MNFCWQRWTLQYAISIPSAAAYSSHLLFPAVIWNYLIIYTWQNGVSLIYITLFIAMYRKTFVLKFNLCHYRKGSTLYQRKEIRDYATTGET
jgi:hypothetical protein